MTSPNSGPAHGLHPRSRSPTPEQRKLVAARDRRPDRARSSTRDYPGVEFLQWPGGLVASVFSNGYIAPLVVEVRGDNLESSCDAQSQARSPRSRAPFPGIRDVYVRRSRTTTPRSASTPTARTAGLVGVTARDAAQTTLEATLGNINTPERLDRPDNGQSYYVVTYYDGKRSRDPSALAQIPVRVDRRRRRP